ncbi:MAG: inositol monophosphatase family protein [Trueperaceae bacterium]
MTDEQTDFLHTAVVAAQEAARIHRFHIGGDLDVATKSNETDLVTKVDKMCEQRIRDLILERYPHHTVLGEEMGGPGSDAQGNEAEYRWIVDPLDGTVNYAHGFPFYCVSIALEIRGKVEVGVVLDSAHHEMFSAVRGNGAYLDGAPMRTSGESDPARAMLATGFAYDPDRLVENSHVFMRVLPHVRAIRRPGAAALDLCYVAAGRLDAFWEITLNAWDVAAGVLIVEEAGGRVTTGNGDPYRLDDPVLIASNGWLHEPLVELLALHDIKA